MLNTCKNLLFGETYFSMNTLIEGIGIETDVMCGDSGL